MPPPPWPPPPESTLNLDSELENVNSLLEADNEYAGRIINIVLSGGVFRRLVSTNQQASAKRRLQLGSISESRLVFSNATRSSEVVIAGEAFGRYGLSAINAPGNGASIIVMLPGSPVVTLRHLRFVGGRTDVGYPAIQVVGGSLIIEECVFESHAAALHASNGAEVQIVNARFEGNGNAQYNGGAIHATSLARVTIVGSKFTHNQGAEGGAIYAVRSVVDVFNTSLLANRALSGSGGAIHTVDTTLTLANATLLRDNAAALNGHSAYLVRGQGRYILAAPLGHYVQGASRCDPSAECSDPSTLAECLVNLAANGCDRVYEGRHLTKLANIVDDPVFPPFCSAGFVGSSLLPDEQNSVRCSMACPSGKYCEEGSSEPIDCRIGSYCVSGSPLPVPCVPYLSTSRMSLHSSYVTDTRCPHTFVWQVCPGHVRKS